MSAQELLADLETAGVRLTVRGDFLSFTAAKGVLTPERMAAMKRHKQDLIRLLAARSQGSPAAGERYRASLGQEALWVVHQEDPAGASYNTAAALTILSPVDVAALRRALVKLQMRHESLRTTFAIQGGELWGEVHPEPRADLRQVDASALDDDQLRATCQAEYSVPFNLVDGPLLRARLFSRGHAEHVLLLVVHHIVFDAASLWILQRELQLLYAAETTDQPGLLPAVAAPFRDFARWQREFVASAAGERQWESWQARLAGDCPPGELRWSSERPRRGGRRGATLTAALEAPEAEALRRLARDLGVTPFVAGLAVYQALIHRSGGQPDFVVGTATSGRGRREFAATIGYFVNTLPLRTRIAAGMTFAELVQQARQAVHGALEAADYPFAELVRRLNPPRSGNAPPLCRLVFGIQKAHAFAEVAQLIDDGGEVDWGGLRVCRYPLAQQEGQFDLSLELEEGSQGFECVLKYDRNLLSPEAAARFLRHYRGLLAGVAADPHRPLDRYPLADTEERQTLDRWSRGDDLPPPRHQTYDLVFADTVAAHAGRTALVHGLRRWSFMELDRWSAAVAERFRGRGVAAGDRVVVCTRRDPVAPACLLAALRCGAAYVPVAPDCPAPRLAAILAECGPAAVVVDESSLPLVVPHVPPGVAVLASGELTGESPSPAEAPAAGLARPARGTLAAYILHTSGSSGMPKAVVVSQQALCLHVASMARVYGMTAADRVLQFTELSFDPSIEQFLVAWSVGATVVMRGDAVATCDEFWDQVEREQLTVLNVPPSFFAICTEHLRMARRLRLVIVGGDVFPAHLLPAWREHPARLVNAYGPTEGVITATTHDVTPRGGGGRVPIGRPKPGSRAWILGPAGEPAGIGEPGEICLGGPMLAAGYLSPTSDGERRFQTVSVAGGPPEPIYRTGDLGRWTEAGEIEFLGRLDRQLKIRGFRIEPGEIEAALAEHADVRRAFVQGCADRDRPYLAAFVVPRPGATIDPAALSRFLKSRVPPYMVPERIGVLAELPLNTAGKVALERLPALPAPGTAMTGVRTPPRTEVERLMVEAWREILQLDAVGIHDDYYSLGGGSLQSLRIVTRLRELGLVRSTPGDELSPQLLFQYVTIAELSPLLALESALAADPATVGAAAGGACPT